MNIKVVKFVVILTSLSPVWQQAAWGDCLRPRATEERKDDKQKLPISVDDKRPYFIKNYLPEEIALIKKSVVVFGQSKWSYAKYEKIPSSRTVFGKIARDSNGKMVGLIIFIRNKHGLCKILQILVHEDYIAYDVEGVLIEHIKLLTAPGGGIRKIFAFVREKDSKSRMLFQKHKFQISVSNSVRRNYDGDEDAYVFVFSHDMIDAEDEQTKIIMRSILRPLAVNEGWL